jgi:hypothetical protein
MSTELYPQLDDQEIRQLERLNGQRDKEWLINDVIKPQVPNVLETLTTCLNLITSVDQVKLPLTTRTEQVKGVMTRVGDEIVGMDVLLSLNTFSKRLRLKMREDQHLQLVQWTELIHLINETINNVVLLQDIGGDGFLEKLNSVMVTLTKCSTVLNKPHEQLLFPQHKIEMETLFEPDGKLLTHYKDRLSIDIYLLNSEITLELRSLAHITEEPWCHIDEDGKSHVDKLRDDLKHHKVQLNDILTERYSIGHVLGFNKFNAHDYLTRGITFHGQVVIEVEKLSIPCQDPTLLSVGAKLNGLEHLVSKMYRNLDLAALSMDS